MKTTISKYIRLLFVLFALALTFAPAPAFSTHDLHAVSATTCSACSGSGICWVCHGQGKRISGEPCGVCHGKGRCWYCNGRGKS